MIVPRSNIKAIGGRTKKTAGANYIMTVSRMYQCMLGNGNRTGFMDMGWCMI